MKILIKILIILFIAGCSNGDNNISKIMDKPDFDEIHLTCLDSIALPVISNMWHWKCDSNQLYTFSVQNIDEHFLSVYSYPNFRLLYRYGTKGQGPDDFITVNWANTYKENEIVLYDIMKRKLYSFETGDSLVMKTNIFNLAEIKGERLSKPYTMIHKINDSIFLMKVNMPDIITLEIVDLKNSRQISSYADLPQVKDTKRGRLSYLYDFNVEYRDSTIVCAFTNINRIEILQIDNEYNIVHKLTVGEKKLPEEYLRDSYGNRISFYRNVKCNGKYIFILFQDKKDKSTSTIEVYDLEGNGVVKLCLDQHVENILISPDSNYIYAYHQLIDCDIILKYKIPI
ncbi:MAG: TolB-like 6-bladed beta-propeller domain-containing protein [Bacteroidales bacterium]|nr:TolB-like 6-bladed beta-propeller domain-containing protein [Bacteroidales bacterium]